MQSAYVTGWFAFLKQVSDRYGKSPALRMVEENGPTSVSEGFTLPNSPQDLKTWQNDSYTPRKYIGACQKVFQVLHQGIQSSVRRQGPLAGLKELSLNQRVTVGVQNVILIDLQVLDGSLAVP